MKAPFSYLIDCRMTKKGVPIDFLRATCKPLVGLPVVEIAAMPCVLWPYAKQITGDYVRGEIRVDGLRWHAHSLACSIIHGPAPDGMVACHGPCNEPLCIVHVEWGTRSKNQLDRTRDGTDNRGERHGMHKLVVADVVTICSLLDEGELSLGQIATRFGVGKVTIHGIKTGRLWSWLTGRGAG